MTDETIDLIVSEVLSMLDVDPNIKDGAQFAMDRADMVRVVERVREIYPPKAIEPDPTMEKIAETLSRISLGMESLINIAHRESMK